MDVEDLNSILETTIYSGEVERIYNRVKIMGSLCGSQVESKTLWSYVSFAMIDNRV
jgi:hypothetical protein